jgi:hypothetical protein
MIYTIGPHAAQAKNAEEFIAAVKQTGENLVSAVQQYNRPTADRIPIDVVRVCLVSVHPNSPLLSPSLSLSPTIPTHN